MAGPFSPEGQHAGEAAAYKHDAQPWKHTVLQSLAARLPWSGVLGLCQHMLWLAHLPPQDDLDGPAQYEALGPQRDF